MDYSQAVAEAEDDGEECILSDLHLHLPPKTTTTMTMASTDPSQSQLGSQQSFNTLMPGQVEDAQPSPSQPDLDHLDLCQVDDFDAYSHPDDNDDGAEVDIKMDVSTPFFLEQDDESILPHLATDADADVDTEVFGLEQEVEQLHQEDDEEDDEDLLLAPGSCIAVLGHPEDSEDPEDPDPEQQQEHNRQGHVQILDQVHAFNAYQCMECDQTFAALLDLKRHELGHLADHDPEDDPEDDQHDDLQKMMCELCSLQFEHESELSRHMKFHAHPKQAKKRKPNQKLSPRVTPEVKSSRPRSVPPLRIKLTKVVAVPVPVASFEPPAKRVKVKLPLPAPVPKAGTSGRSGTKSRSAAAKSSSSEVKVHPSHVHLLTNLPVVWLRRHTPEEIESLRTEGTAEVGVGVDVEVKKCSPRGPPAAPRGKTAKVKVTPKGKNPRPRRKKKRTVFPKNYRRDPGREPIPCPYPSCPRTFLNKSHWGSHQRSHTGEKPFPCTHPGCPLFFQDSIRRKRHEVAAHRFGVKDHACPHPRCTFTAETPYALRVHARKHTGERPFRCDLCPKAFMYACHLTQHRRTHTGERPFTCTSCEETFIDTARRARHFRRVHVNGGIVERPHLCEECGKAYPSAPALQDHRRAAHTGEKPFQCDQCPARFARQAGLKVHLRVHLAPTERPFPCRYCDHSSITSTLHKRHEETHGERTFACEFCPKKFRSAMVLNIHRRQHTGEKPYRCEFCDESFAHLGNLGYHKLARHSEPEDKQFACGFCEKKFVRKADQTLHEYVHAGVKPFPCDVCAESFARAYCLRRHRAAKHGLDMESDDANGVLASKRRRNFDEPGRISIPGINGPGLGQGQGQGHGVGGPSSSSLAAAAVATILELTAADVGPETEDKPEVNE